MLSVSEAPCRLLFAGVERVCDGLVAGDVRGEVLDLLAIAGEVGRRVRRQAHAVFAGLVDDDGARDVQRREPEGEQGTTPASNR